MKNKGLVVALIIIAAVLLLFGYNQFLAPKTVEGEKNVTINVVIESKGIDKEYEFNTDKETLYDLLKEKESELKASFKKFDFGIMLVGLENYEADQSKNEYFHIKVNGEDATVGIQEQPVKDGDIFKFELKTW